MKREFNKEKRHAEMLSRLENIKREQKQNENEIAKLRKENEELKEIAEIYGIVL